MEEVAVTVLNWRLCNFWARGFGDAMEDLAVEPNEGNLEEDTLEEHCFARFEKLVLRPQMSTTALKIIMIVCIHRKSTF